MNNSWTSQKNCDDIFREIIVKFSYSLTHMASQWKQSNLGDHQFFQQIEHKWNFPNVSLPEIKKKRIVLHIFTDQNVVEK